MGELARQPGCPELARTPIELLTPRPGEGYTDFEKWAYPIGGALTGLAYTVGRNVMKMRPKWAGIQLHLILTATGYFVGAKVRDIKFAARAEADEAAKHYISLHPEDFPPFERKRYRDVYKPFDPVR